MRFRKCMPGECSCHEVEHGYVVSDSGEQLSGPVLSLTGLTYFMGKFRNISEETKQRLLREAKEQGLPSFMPQHGLAELEKVIVDMFVAMMYPPRTRLIITLRP